MRIIQRGEAEIVITGGAEAPLPRWHLPDSAPPGHCRPATTNPTKASRPFDVDRDGFVMGEGAAILVLEEEEHAKKRGAKIYADLVGCGMSADAYHITAPSPDGDGAARSMRAALKDAGFDV